MHETQFDVLPREVVGVILDSIDPTEQQKFRRVSKFWNRNICSLYGAALTVHNTNLELNLTSTACPIKAYFQSLTLPFPMNKTGTDFLHRLTSLTFSGHVVCYNIFPVLEQCIYARKLELIMFNPNLQMKEYEVYLEDPYKLLPELRALTIKFNYRPFNESEYKFLKNLLPFLTANDGKLDSIILDCPHTGGPLGVPFDKIFKKNSFRPYEENAPPHRPLDLSIAEDFYKELIESNLQTLQNLEMADGTYGCRINMKLFPNIGSGDSEIQFSEFEQSLYSKLKIDAYYSSIEVEVIALFNLLKPQTHLTKLAIGISSTFTLDQIYSIANNNAATLGHLTIWYSFHENERLDASAMPKLPVLKMFKYSKCSTEKSHLEEEEGVVASLINISSLPTSLRTLISTAPLEFENEDNFSMTAFASLQNLETLELTAIPFFNLGEDVSVFRMNALKIRQIVAWIPSLKKLVLRNNRPHLWHIQEFDEDVNQGHDNFNGRTDTLPSSATDWMNNNSRITYQKIPIDFTGHQIYENPGLIGRHFFEWDWNKIYRMNRYGLLYNRNTNDNDNEFPVRFDGIISIGPEFRTHNPLPE